MNTPIFDAESPQFTDHLNREWRRLQREVRTVVLANTTGNAAVNAAIATINTNIGDLTTRLNNAAIP